MDTQNKTQIDEVASQGEVAEILRLEGVGRVFPGEFVALADVNLVVNAGEFVSIVGHSGAGKSTLLRMIYAEDTPTTGEVYFQGRPVSKIKRKILPFYRRNIGTVFQDFRLLPNRTVFENVAFALEVQGVSTANIEDEVPRILEIVGLENKMEMFPPQLSGGEQQKVSLARALIHRPKIIVADEPTGNLDPNSTWDIIQLLLKINDYGTTVILATHDKDVVDKINGRVVTMEKARIVRDNHESKYII